MPVIIRRVLVSNTKADSRLSADAATRWVFQVLLQNLNSPHKIKQELALSERKRRFCELIVLGWITNPFFKAEAKFQGWQREATFTESSRALHISRQRSPPPTMRSPPKT